MNKYVKCFLHRGLIFGGFGPVVTAILFLVLSYFLDDLSLDGEQIFTAVVSTYLLAFVQAGASVFNQIEEWPLAKSLLWHFLTLYLAYSACYILNSWIPFELQVLLIFTGIFAVAYFVIWLTVYFAVKSASRRFNAKLG